ncbi:hypothetical protein J23TS9_52740 [Paenibacillus sp. J23TS9]|uniref:hypothetical protein n=1 Tax=Paenibacillus sp. J23TS9 TaxID=2807193 RepID=UPI001B2E7A14|nr:hypothetical protein [Paenibacillus sp. J23TS9]GIP30144.1 hypothetical protein J23TS9_52740 [Paenibacillus sp. J23TS9]
MTKITFGGNGYADDYSYIDVTGDASYLGEDETEYIIPSELQDLQDYADMLAPIEVYETNAITAYEKYRVVTSSNRKAAHNSLTNTVIPNYKKVVSMTSKISAPNAELQAIHSLMVKGAKLQLEGFTLMQQAIYKKTSFTAANKKLDAGRAAINQYTAKVQAYADKYSK